MKRLTALFLLLGAAACTDRRANDDHSSSESDVVSSSCSSLSLDDMKERARDFVLSEGLGQPSDEADIIAGVMRSRWTALDVVTPHVANPRSRCLVVMNVGTEIIADGKTTVEASATYEVIAIDPKTKTFERFEQAIAVPERLQASYGPAYSRTDANEWVPETSFYYVELTGNQVLDTWKSVAAGLEYSGFAADISAKNVKTTDATLYGEPDGKAEFDPTPGRTWKLVNAEYSLRRGYTAEILDVYAPQIDGDFLTYYSGSGGEVAPWGAFVRRWKLPTDANWTDTKMPPVPYAGSQ